MASIEGRKPPLHVKFSNKHLRTYKRILPPNGVRIYTDYLLDGGARAGKTFLICFLLCEIALDPAWSGIRILIAREKYNHAVLSIWKQTLVPMVKKYFAGWFTFDESYKILTAATGSQIWLGGLDDKERTDKIFGQEFAIIFLNEVVQISEQTLEKVQTRLAQKIAGFKNFMIYDCNPRSPAHYIYRMFYLDKNPRRFRETFTPYDNLENISEDLIERLSGMKESTRRRFRDGEWCEVEGTVYSNVLETHRIKAKKDWAAYDYIVGGIDWGYHAAVVVWGVKDTRAVCMYEAAPIGGSTAQVVQALQSFPAWVKEHVTFFADHENDRIELVRDEGYNVSKAHKEVGAGDGTVNDYSLYFDRGCQETFQSMLNLMRVQDKDGHYTDDHVKVNDHAADASRYALHSAKIERYGERDEHFLRKKVL